MTEGGANPFSTRAVIILVSVSVLSLAGAFALSIFGDDLRVPPTSGPSAYSRSAIGHHAAIEILDRLGVPVLVSRNRSGARASHGVLVLAEPMIDGGNVARVRDMAAAAARTLVILPKRVGTPSQRDPAWVDDTDLIATSDVDAALGAFVDDARVVREDSAEAPEWVSSEIVLGDQKRAWPAPTLASPQLIVSSKIEPLVATRNGRILLGAMGSDHHLLILSDPDVIANHGIGRGHNALLWATAIASLRSSDETVVVDETVHGHQATPSLWRTLFEFPLALVTAELALLFAVLLWATVRRFGSPRPPVPALTPGKEFLIENTASLLHFGGHSNEMLLRYFHDTVRDVRRRLRAPVRLSTREGYGWLDRIGEARGVSDSIADIDAATAELCGHERSHSRRVTQAARRIHTWKEEMLRGSANRPTH